MERPLDGALEGCAISGGRAWSGQGGCGGAGRVTFKAAIRAGPGRSGAPGLDRPGPGARDHVAVVSPHRDGG
ncbi:MAG: hypothetical protein EHM56_00195 [Chloroflexi bacterium]|nr:MAG: hypothetical protein EHM56_00195 [Chloroflexota bacterium]